MSKASAARRKRHQQHSSQHRNEQASPMAPTNSTSSSTNNGKANTTNNGKAYSKASKTGKPSTPPRKQHGPWMTAALVYIGLDGILSAILLFAFKKDPTAAVPPWLLAGAAAVAIATIVSAVAMWYWKRWGLYLLVAATLGSIAVGIVAFPMQAMIVAFHALIPLGLLSYVLTYQKKMPLLT